MKKNGFTLVELLAVIVILGIIMAITSSSLIATRKKANQNEVDSLYNTIKSLGPEVYLNEKKSQACYSAGWLKKEGYLKSEIKNPANSKENCTAYLIIDNTKDPMFDAYIECSGLEPEPKGTSIENIDIDNCEQSQ